MRVLLVEDDAATARSVSVMLNALNYVVDVADSGEDGVQIGRLYDYDVIILDLMLPDMDGYDVLRRFRSAGVNTPILILSGLLDTDNKIKGFGFGADDYLTKPFDKGELAARIKAIVRRSKGHSDSVIHAGRLAVDLETKTANIDGAQVPLTTKEYAILELLALRKGQTLTKANFLNHLYGGVDEPDLKIVDVFVCKLRKKLEKGSGGETFIETVWGRGYVLRDGAAPTTGNNAEVGAAA
jgi:two-component system cell cycle response regulator CtrA